MSEEDTAELVLVPLRKYNNTGSEISGWGDCSLEPSAPRTNNLCPSLTGVMWTGTSDKQGA